jgi:hypothetical protein
MTVPAGASVLKGVFNMNTGPQKLFRVVQSAAAAGRTASNRIARHKDSLKAFITLLIQMD